MARRAERIRAKHDFLVSDPFWHDIQRHPNSVGATVGGVISDGTYTISVVPENSSGPFPSSFIRGAGEDEVAIADELRQAMEANADLDVFFASITDDDAGTVTAIEQSIRIATPHTPFRMTTSAPGSATITLSPDSIFPTTELVPDGFNAAVVSFKVVDSGGAVIASPDARADVDLVTVTQGTVKFGPVADTIGRIGPFPSHELANVLPISDLIPGQELAVRFGPLSNPPIGIDAVEAWVDWLRA